MQILYKYNYSSSTNFVLYKANITSLDKNKSLTFPSKIQGIITKCE